MKQKFFTTSKIKVSDYVNMLIGAHGNQGTQIPHGWMQMDMEKEYKLERSHCDLKVGFSTTLISLILLPLRSINMIYLGIM